MILSFELTMPNVGSWNGKWTSEDKKYYRHRTVTKKVGEKLMNDKKNQSFYYNFGDGWSANVEATIVSYQEKAKREKISRGFYGYEWMIDEILEYGRILTRKERIKKKKGKQNDRNKTI